MKSLGAPQISTMIHADSGNWRLQSTHASESTEHIVPLNAVYVKIEVATEYHRNSRVC